MYSRAILRCNLKPHQHTFVIVRSFTPKSSASDRTAWGQPSYLSYPYDRYKPRVYSSVNSTVAALFIATSIFGGSLYYYQQLRQKPEGNFETILEKDTEAEDLAIMTGTLLPGRPGNLTPEQEVKLQEMWTATLHIFGVPVPVDHINGDTESTTGSENQEKRSRAGTDGSEKKKKSRMSMFSRKNHDDSSAESVEGTSIANGEDKYGQTKEFHKVLASQSPEDIRTAFWSMVKHDNPDGLLLRFLRARKWNVQNALVMLVATMNWRMQEMHVDDDIIKRGEGGAAEYSRSSNANVRREGEDFLSQMRLGKSFLHGTDKEGRPMCFVRVRLHKKGEQTESSVERYTVYTIETARLLLHSNVDTAAIVFDMTDFSLANMDYGPVKFMIKVFEANYPESLGVVLVHKSPWIFQSIWKIIQGWLDPVVANKVHFTKNVEELEQFVDRSHIIKELGGDDPWTYQYVEPIPEENKLLAEDETRQRLLDNRASVVKEFEATTQQWIKGSQSREALRQKRAELAERLRSGYWELDPFLRARTLYDRTGMIKEGGKIQFYENEAPKATVTPLKSRPAPATNGPTPAGHGDDDVD